MKYFLIIGTLNCATYKDVMPSIKRGEAWLGHNNKNMIYNVPASYPLEGSSCGIDEKGQKWIECTGVRWLTNIGEINRKPLQLTEHYSPEKYPKYDNYDAVEVSRVKNIPCDYYGEMGVPATFLDKHCPEQFEVIGVYNDFRSEFDGGISGFPVYIDEKHPMWQGPSVNFKTKYFRIIIKRKNNDKN